jgi:hypothetical protein
MNKITINYNDAVHSLRMFHSLPSNMEIEIEYNNKSISPQVLLLYSKMIKLWNTRIPMIKEVRTTYGTGLRTAKYCVDEIYSDCDVNGFPDKSIFTEQYLYNMLQRHKIEK